MHTLIGCGCILWGRVEPPAVSLSFLWKSRKPSPPGLTTIEKANIGGVFLFFPPFLGKILTHAFPLLPRPPSHPPAAFPSSESHTYLILSPSTWPVSGSCSSAT